MIENANITLQFIFKMSIQVGGGLIVKWSQILGLTLLKFELGQEKQFGAEKTKKLPPTRCRWAKNWRKAKMPICRTYRADTTLLMKRKNSAVKNYPYVMPKSTTLLVIFSSQSEIIGNFCTSSGTLFFYVMHGIYEIAHSQHSISKKLQIKWLISASRKGNFGR